MKTCTKCNLIKESIHFYVKSQNPLKMTANCKNCLRLSRKIYRQSNLDKARKAFNGI
jgi:hypothetical protein